MAVIFAVNTRAFEYESIEDDQFTKELWINIAALVVTVAVTVVCPPAGFVLGAAYAGAEMGSAISGKDWASGRELDTSERWLRGIAAPVDILPVGKAATTFTGTARTTNKVVDLGSALNKTKLSSSLAGDTAHQTSKVKLLVETAGQQTSSRLRNASHSVKNSTSVLKNKLGEEAIKVAQKGDAGITKVLNMFPQANLATDNGIMFASPGNFNKLEAGTAKVVDRLGAASKGTGNTNKIKKIDEIKFENAMVEAARNQPSYTRKPNKPRNFTSKFRNEDGTTTYTFLSKKNGKEYNVTYDKKGFPIFDSKHEITLPEKLHLDTDAVQFDYLSKMLYKEINEKPELLSRFSDSEIELLKAGRVPQTLTWHHHQHPGKMQIVDYFEHQAASHTGGRAIWGGGEAGRKGEIKKQILELSVWD